MTEETLMDDQSLDVDLYEEVQQKNKKYIKWAVFLAILNTILYTLCLFEVLPSTLERFGLAAYMSIIGLPLMSFLSGLLLAFIPYRGLTWKQKYKRASLFALLACSTIMAIGLLFIGLALLYGYLFN
ncbi:hypothetical protein [Aureispira sp. CCB-E]|uniref:hypothetical protein n=1 Tax=Aureispira sp. CCB-E TaxID=3051121 RepID=UPI0028690F1D|nr:hypothetical protein [Aureispira sp. CCB-E]WMX16132.1 hypothetical protein QP953_07110 [Aureispira sp. CCB-E]